MDEAYERVVECQFGDDGGIRVPFMGLRNPDQTFYVGLASVDEFEGPWGGCLVQTVANAEAVDLIDAGEYPAMPCGAD